jgi:hypothetical protein
LEENNISDDLVRFSSEIVHASADIEISFLSPVGTIGVTDDPVFHFELLIVTITDDKDGMVNFEPLELVLFPAVVRHLSVLFIFLGLSFLRDSQSGHTEVVVVNQNTR